MQALLNALSAVTEADLKSIDEKIASLKNELEALQQIQKLVAIRLGVVAPKTARGNAKNFHAEPTDEEPIPPGSNRSDVRRARIVAFIKANGPSTMAAIAKGLGIPNGSMNALLSDRRFIQMALGYGLTENHK